MFQRRIELVYEREEKMKPPRKHERSINPYRFEGVHPNALFIRPDGCVAWALPTGQDLDATTLVRALGTWFGQPA